MASVIYYLSHAKDILNSDALSIKNPSIHMNSIFINTEKSEKSNKPRYVKHKRRTKINIENINQSSSSSTDSSSDELSSNEDLPEHIMNEAKLKRKKCLDKPTLNKKLKTSVNSASKRIELLNKVCIDDEIPNFTQHVPINGGFFIVDNKKIGFINTCTIDYYLLSFWVMNYLIKDFKKAMPALEHTTSIINIINNIEIGQWDMARQIWYSDVMKMSLFGKKQVNFYGTVEDFFLQYMKLYQKHDLIQKCTRGCIYNGNLIVEENLDILHFGRLKNNEIGIVTSIKNKCAICKQRVMCDVFFKNEPIFIFIETSSLLKITEIPKIIDFDAKTFKLLCVIFHFPETQHFVSVYEINNHFFLVDDLKRKVVLLEDGKVKKTNYFSFNISSSLYYILR